LRLYVIHCLYTPQGREVSAEEVIRWHTGPKAKGHRGWSRPGYREIIHIDGSESLLHDYDFDQTLEGWEVTNGVKGHNHEAAHIAYVGGMKDGKPYDTRTASQIERMEYKVLSAIELWPDIQIAGHNQLSAKACPCFDVPEFCRDIGIPANNIF